MKSFAIRVRNTRTTYSRDPTQPPILLQCALVQECTPYTTNNMDIYLRKWRQDALNRGQHEAAIYIGDKVLALTSM